jgi:restriction endonuclease S subunit
MEKIKLGEYCIKKINNVPKQGDFNIDYIDISSIDNKSKSVTGYNTYEISDAPSRAKQLLVKNDVLVSTVRPNLNAIALCDIDTENTLVGSTGFCVLRGNDKVNSKYVYYFCQSKYFVGELMKVATGASYPAVSKNDVKNVMIPKLRIDKQNEIVSTLDAVTGIISSRKEQLELLDSLINSKFVLAYFKYLSKNPLSKSSS